MEKTLKEEQKYLESKLKHNSDSILFARLAELYLSLDRVDDAIKLCEDGIRKHPSYVTGHYILSKCYMKQNKFENAKKELRRVLYYDEYYMAAHRDYGDLMDKEGWTKTAVDSYNRILEADPLNRVARDRYRNIKGKSSLNKDESDSGSDIDMAIDIDIEDDLEGQSDILPDRPVDHSYQAPQEFDSHDDLLALDKLEDEKVTENPDNEIYDILNNIFHEDDINDDIDFKGKRENAVDLSQDDSDSNEQEQTIDDFSTTFHGNDVEVPEIKELEDDNFRKMEEMRDDNDAFEDFIKTVKTPDPIPSEEPDSSESYEYQKSKKTVKEPPAKLVTPTLGEIYISQGQFAKALGVYQLLFKNNPENQIYKQKIEYLKKKLEEINQE